MSSSLTPTSEKPSVRGPVGRFLQELRRRKVLASAGLYLAGSFIVVQVLDAIGGILFDDPEAAGGIILSLLVIGFPIAMIVAWFGQLKRELRADEAEEEKTSLERLGARKELRPDTVGVLPFDNLSDDPQNAYFSDGITDDIMMSISQIRGLRVLPRTTVRQYKNDNRPSAEIAGELGAATLVTGSVRRSGSRVRVVVVVVDARTEDQLWTEGYDRELEDIFQVQSEIASKVGEAVQRELSSADRERIETRGTTDPEAYDLYLRARFLWNQRSESSVAESLRYFQRALERDPGFALAHSGLADAFTILGVYGIRAPRDVMEAARESADTALSIDPMLGEAVATRACVTAVYDWDWVNAEEGFQHALELAPSYPTAHQWYAVNVLAPQGRFEDAAKHLEQAIGLDPLSSAIATSQGIVAFDRRDLDAAVREFEAVAKLHSRFSLVRYFLGQCYGLSGEVERGIESLQLAVRLVDESSETLAALGHALAVAERTDDAEAILHRLEERRELRYVSAALLAQVLIGLGRSDEALDRLDQATEERATDLIWVGVRPVYDALRDSDRFEALERTLGLSRA